MPYRTFVSSTFKDLSDHRSHAIAALRKADFSVNPMEDWTAATSEPKLFSQAGVQDCDLLILLVALRRGHVPVGETLSITQLEYQAAVALDIDVSFSCLTNRPPGLVSLMNLTRTRRLGNGVKNSWSTKQSPSLVSIRNR